MVARFGIIQCHHRFNMGSWPAAIAGGQVSILYTTKDHLFCPIQHCQIERGADLYDNKIMEGAENATN